jgi:N-methylhydantoinase A
VTTLDPAGSLVLAVDVGGTFTDVTLADPVRGQVWSLKTPTTPADPSEGFVRGADRILGVVERTASDVGGVFHGTTIATNLILEGKGARTALVTTRGFQFVLEIGRHDIPRRENMYLYVKPARPIPPELVFEVGGRLDRSGAELAPLDEAACREAAQQCREAGIESIAICLLHAYADPRHERRVLELMREAYPAACYSLSSEVLPVFREYERSITTALNAYVMPPVSGYVNGLQRALRERGAKAPLYIMKSNGGVLSADAVQRQPVFTALSGPAAGVMGARHVGRLAGEPNLISIDVGGTSADVCLIRDGQANVTTEGHIGTWPLAAPTVDIQTVGAGGGSIAAVTPSGDLIVGPASAGAVPGPACYGKGGRRPTVTDANLVLGRIPPHLLGGEIALDVGLATEAIRIHVAEPLGIDVVRAASGILEIVNNNMLGAIRLITTERGNDPRDFALLPFGGGGPMHAGDLARLLGMRLVIIPPKPGVLSTLGLLATDIRNDYVRTAVLRGPDFPVADIATILEELSGEADAWLAAEGVAAEAREITWLADLRYANQLFELSIPFPGATVTDATIEALVAAFHARHEALYSYAARDAVVEIVNLRVTAVGALDRPEASRLAPAAGEPVPVGRRSVHFAEAGGFVDCPVFNRDGLAPGSRFTGPAIIDQLDTTIVVHPGQAAETDAYGNLLVRGLDAG